MTLIGVVKLLENCIIGGDFNAFNNAWGSTYNDNKGLLLIDELDSLCILNDGTPTRIPNGKTK